MLLLTTLLTVFTSLVGAVCILSITSLLLLLLAAVLPRRRANTAKAAPLALAVIVPAHDEALVLAATLDSLTAQDFPKECVEIVVVADNCTDSTAAIACAHGVTVLERLSAEERGKGYALNFALAYLHALPQTPDGVVVVDADTFAAPDFLTRIGQGLDRSRDRRGFGAVQGRYGVLNSGDGWRAALMEGAFDLVNHVKPLGRERLGLSAGLKGNGMAFTWPLASALPWPGGSLTEDLDYGLDLARRFGVRVAYVPDARVRAQMPATAAQAASQRDRWERGRAGLTRERGLPLLWEGLRGRNPLLLDMAWDLLTPPLAELGALLCAWVMLVGGGGVLGWLPHAGHWARALGLTGAGLLVYILGGLRVAGASREAYVALARAPFYAAWKISLRLAGRRGGAASTEWVRTSRMALPAEPTAPAPASPEAEAASR